jgi:uncharacterized protein (UPF0371 family)
MQGAAFDNEKYIKEQTSEILERTKKFGHKLYLEFGGKLLYDYHASRVLPGYDPNIKMRLLKELREKADIILCIYAGDIERKKIRADFGITYDSEALKLIDDLRGWGVDVLGVVITRFNDQPSAILFKNRLERRDIKVYTHQYTKGYPTDVDLIVSDEGYGANDFIESKKPLIIVTGPGPGSGKLATCLSQVYHEYRKGINAGYAKFETFPIWNLPINHPVNIAYEAATADIKDFNLIDPFHLEAYNEKALNYNRDVEVFPVLRRILKKISGGDSLYQSPTDMGVNRAGFAIKDDELTKEASKQEIIRRFFRYKCEYVMGLTDRETVQRVELLIKDLNSGAAIKLEDGTIVTGSNSSHLHAASSLILHAIKQLAEIPDKIKLLPENITAAVRSLKTEVLNEKTLSLDLVEALIALSIGATTNPAAQLAMEKLTDLKGCEVHMTHMPTPGDEAGLRRLGVNLTTDPNFSSKDLFVS